MNQCWKGTKLATVLWAYCDSIPPTKCLYMPNSEKESLAAVWKQWRISWRNAVSLEARKLTRFATSIWNMVRKQSWQINVWHCKHEGCRCNCCNAARCFTENWLIFITFYGRLKISTDTTTYSNCWARKNCSDRQIIVHTQAQESSRKSAPHKKGGCLEWLADCTSHPASGFMQLLEWKDAMTLLPIIQHHVWLKSLLYSDERVAHNQVRNIPGLETQKVNCYFLFIQWLVCILKWTYSRVKTKFSIEIINNENSWGVIYFISHWSIQPPWHTGLLSSIDPQKLEKHRLETHNTCYPGYSRLTGCPS